MRTIKYRGLAVNMSEPTWLYGSLVVCDDGTCMIADYMESGFGVKREVYPETVGQFTGLLDKNGKEIYEGDIVAVYDEDDNKIGQGEVEFLEDWGVWYISATIDDGLFDVNYNYYIEVIGNIHDNPELLKNND